MNEDELLNLLSRCSRDSIRDVQRCIYDHRDFLANSALVTDANGSKLISFVLKFDRNCAPAALLCFVYQASSYKDELFDAVLIVLNQLVDHLKEDIIPQFSKESKFVVYYF